MPKSELEALTEEVSRLRLICETLEIAQAAQATAIFDLQNKVVKLIGEMLVALQPHQHK